MANYIKIPLAINPGRSFKLQALAEEATWEDATGTLVAGTAVTAQAVLGGSGSGAIATVQVAGGTALSNVTATITTAGEGYKVGDTITFAAETTGGGASTWSEPLAFAVVAADLVTVEGSTTNSFQLVPVDNVAFVKPVSATSAEIVTNLWDASAGRSLKWTVTVDDVPASTEAQLAADLAEAINKASQAENDVPTVSFYNDAEVIDVDYS